MGTLTQNTILGVLIFSFLAYVCILSIAAYTFNKALSRLP